MDIRTPKVAKSLKKYSNPRSSKIREFIRINFLSSPLWKTKKFKDKVLDLGCGWGFYFKINPKAYGIDFDKNCVNYLKNSGYKVIKGDIRKRLQFQDNFFSRVIAHDVLEHFELNEIKKILLEAHRILKLRGLFLILIPNYKGFKYGLRTNVGHKHFIFPKEIFLITKGKFIIEKHYSYPLPRFIGNYFTHNKEIIILKKT